MDLCRRIYKAIFNMRVDKDCKKCNTNQYIITYHNLDNQKFVRWRCGYCGYEHLLYTYKICA